MNVRKCVENSHATLSFTIVILCYGVEKHWPSMMLKSDRIFQELFIEERTVQNLSTNGTVCGETLY